ncbi:hypothetical protein CV093_04495 [Oceanobacillus sp. 143]|nr:hypothetical protein CV093_04495 [Oceanobacillus sp. 143]
MVFIDVLSHYQGIIGTIIGFLLSYFSSRTGKIKLQQQNCYINFPNQEENDKNKPVK